MLSHPSGIRATTCGIASRTFSSACVVDDEEGVATRIETDVPVVGWYDVEEIARASSVLRSLRFRLTEIGTLNVVSVHLGPQDATWSSLLGLEKHLAQ